MWGRVMSWGGLKEVGSAKTHLDGTQRIVSREIKGQQKGGVGE